MRRELPSGREVPWEPALYASPAVLARPADLPRLVRDTLAVNKLYATDFLRAHGIRFPEGRFPYEDIVFTARVWAAAPRVALVPDRVHVWHVRRAAPRLSISLDRADVGNWRARTHACRTAHTILLDAGEKRLARAVRAKSSTTTCACTSASCRCATRPAARGGRTAATISPSTTPPTAPAAQAIVAEGVRAVARVRPRRPGLREAGGPRVPGRTRRS
ncbi:hypothetical protein SALBM217S_01647 [Streptomyces griseoloalbus]